MYHRVVHDILDLVGEHAQFVFLAPWPAWARVGYRAASHGLLGDRAPAVAVDEAEPVGAAIEGVVAEVLSWNGNEDVRSVNAVVGETNDGGLSDIRALRVRPNDVRAAIRAAAEGPVAEGSVGAGTGTRCCPGPRADSAR